MMNHQSKKEQHSLSVADILAIEQLYDNDENDRINENLVIEGINLNDICTADELVIIREKMAKLKCDLYNIFGKQNNNLNDKEFEDMCNAVMHSAGSRIKVKPFVYPTPKMNNISNGIDTNNKRNNNNKNNNINSKKKENPFVYPTPKIDNNDSSNNKNNKKNNENKNGIGSIDNSNKNVFYQKRFGEMSKNKGENQATDLANDLNKNNNENENEYSMENNNGINDRNDVNGNHRNNNNNNNNKKYESVYDGLENVNIDININKFVMTQGKEMNGINDRNDRKNDGNGDGFCTNSWCCIVGMDFDCNDNSNNNNNNNNTKKSGSVYDGLENANIDININKFIMTQGNGINDIKDDVNGDGICTNSGCCIIGIDLDCNDGNNNNNNNNNINNDKYSNKSDKIDDNKSIYAGLENANINITNITNIITQGKEMNENENENENGMEMEKENIEECDGNSELIGTRLASLIGLCENDTSKI